VSAHNGHDHDHDGPAASPEQRAKALEAFLIEKEVLTEGFIDTVVTTYESRVGPMNGAKVVAKAWSDPEYKAWLLEDATAAAAELGFKGPQGNLAVLENTDEVHNVVVCTLCSCYPWPLLGLPPTWYKSPSYRARMVREPRALLQEMGCDVPEKVEIRVWDSSADKRYLVLPQAPADAAGKSEEELAGLVTRDAMVGVARS
jgi:nitrile hydratase